MQHLCEAFTTGGPVAVLQHQYLPLWDADEDYFEILTHPRNGCLTHVPNFKGRCALFLFHQESDGNFSVYHDPDSILILSEISAADGYEINRHLPPITRAIIDKPPIRLNAFGGKVVVFDATIPGHAIHSCQMGCYQSDSSMKSMSQRYDVALVEVALEKWQVRELFMDEPHLSFSGVWFQRIC